MSCDTIGELMRDVRAAALAESLRLRRECEVEPAPVDALDGWEGVRPLVLSFQATCLHCGGELHQDGALSGDNGVELSGRVTCAECRSSARIRVLWSNGGPAPTPSQGVRF